MYSMSECKKLRTCIDRMVFRTLPVLLPHLTESEPVKFIWVVIEFVIHMYSNYGRQSFLPEAVSAHPRTYTASILSALNQLR